MSARQSAELHLNYAQETVTATKVVNLWLRPDVSILRVFLFLLVVFAVIGERAPAHIVVVSLVWKILLRKCVWDQRTGLPDTFPAGVVLHPLAV